MIDFGIVKPGETLYIPFATYDSNDPSASVTLTGLATTDIEIYKDGGTTQRASDSGYALLDTDGIDFDTITGIHGLSVDLSDNTTAGFYAAGSQYFVVVSSVTVDAATINFIAARFTIGYPDAMHNTTIATLSSQTSFTLTSGSAQNDAYNGCVLVAHDVASDVQMAVGYISDYVGSTKTVTLAADPGIFTMAATDNIAIYPPSNVPAIADGVWDEVLSGGTHNVANSAGRRLRSLQDNGLYALASVWVDEVAGTSSGTTAYEDATVTNRANDFDNAQTVADAVDITNIQVTNGNAITLSAGLEGYNIFANGSTLALGSQNIGGSFFHEFTQVTGTGTTTGGIPVFRDCAIGNATLPPTIFDNSVFYGTVTVGSAGDFLFNSCASYVAGAGAPVLDMGGAVGATTVSFRRWSGGLTLNNVATGDVVSIDAISGGTVTVNGTGGTVHVRGMVKVVDGSSGSVTIVQSQVINDDNINAEVDTALTDYDPPTRTELTTDTNSVLAVVGGVADAAAAGDPSSSETIMQYIKQLVNVLVGTTGITTYPASAAPANNVNIAEVLSSIRDLLVTVESQTDDIGAAGAGLTSIPFTGPTAAQVRAEMDSNSTQLAAIASDAASLNDTKIPDTLSLANINAQVDTAFTTQMADSVASDGTIATREQALYMMLQFLTEKTVSGTTVTVRKVDGSTTLYQMTLNDGTTPTDITRS